jgi:NAD(P)-dependent dehydrogenase (short-subunit alcohol dehydrogenase family)
MYNNLIKAVGMSPPVDTSAPFDPTRIAGKTILITGGALGLGSAFARHWASLGAHLIIGDINDKAGEELVASFRLSDASKRHHYHYIHCDVTDWQSQVDLFASAVRLSPTGGIDTVVANAGIIDRDSANMFENPTEAALAAGHPEVPPKPNMRTLEVNSIGLAYTTYLALFWLPKNDGSSPHPRSDKEPAKSVNRDRHILLMGSVAGLMPLPNQAHYCMSKHSVTGLFRALRGSAARQGVRVNMLCPYFISDTNMLTHGVEALLLSGSAGAATKEDTIDAATRLVADDSIVGRALAVGPKVKVTEGKDGEFVLVDGDGEGEGKAVWECYAEDYADAEMFVWRYVRLLNAIAQIRGWVGWAQDLVRMMLFRK